jgi:hypothetical protein
MIYDKTFFVILNRFPSYRDSLRALHPKSYHYSVKRYYLFLCFGTFQQHLCKPSVPVMSLLHRMVIIVRGLISASFKLQAYDYDLPTIICMLYYVGQLIAIHTYILYTIVTV